MKIAYFDCFAGASGNMILGALVDAGLPLDALEHELRRLPVQGWTMRAERVHKRGLGALYLDVLVPGEDHDALHVNPTVDVKSTAPKSTAPKPHAHRTLADVLSILRAAGFDERIESTAAAIYRRLAQAEARVHRVPLEQIVFHEVGQIDAIIDIAGAAIGLHLLAIDKVFCSPLPCGRGTIHSAHGQLPSPPPATLELLRGFPTYAVDFEGELVTPTGAAVLTATASFDIRPPMTLERVGYGSGRSDFPFANVLRVMIGETTERIHGVVEPADGVVALETNIDDMSPQLFEDAVAHMYAAGALDVWLQPAHMKKGRIGTIVSALAPHERADAVAGALLAHTTTIGVRRWNVERVTLPRSIASVDTSYGPVRVKIVRSPDGIRARPEFEDCKAIAQARGIALAEVMGSVEAEIAGWLTRQTS